MAMSLNSIKEEVVSLAFFVIKVGETYYKFSSALEEFKGNVAKLEGNYESWRKRALQYGLSSDRAIRSALEEAEGQLQREKVRLEKLDKVGCGCLCFWLSTGTEFPDQLGKSIVNLNNTILSAWKANNDAEAATREVAKEKARSPKFNFRRDPRYVKLPFIEKKVKDILNNKDRGEERIRVVLLYGRAGIGKSSMARNLALDYKQAATSAADGSTSSSANGCREFDDVLFLECGPEAKAEVSQAKAEVSQAKAEGKYNVLLRMLGWKSAFETEKDPVDDKLILEQLLKMRQSLIVFDDVWEERFLKDMVAVCGEDMKILVTSQKKNLCERSLIGNFKSVAMDEITTEDSIRILKVHTGFKVEEDVPESVKKCMDILVAKVNGHPHALASVAVAIDASRKTERQQWERAICEYDQLLEHPVSEWVMNPIHDVQYERSFMEAIQMKFKRLTEEERRLLVLMVMLIGSSVPEELLQLFYVEMVAQNTLEGVTSWRSFLTIRRRLEDLQIIKIGEYRFSWYPPRFYYYLGLYWVSGRFGLPGPSWYPSWDPSFHGQQSSDKMYNDIYEGTSWSIHSLDKEFIQKRMESDIDETLEVVKHLPDKVQGIEAKPQVNVVKLLGFLFFKNPSREAIWMTLKNDPTLHLQMGWGAEYDTHADILPLIFLMTKSIGEGWALRHRRSSYQIFLSCVAHCIFHNNAAEELWNSSIPKDKLWALMRRRPWNQNSREWFISEKVINGVLKSFGDLPLPWNASVVASLNSDQWNALLILVSREHLLPARHCVSRMRNLVLGLIDTLKSRSCIRKTKHSVTVVLSYLVPLLCERPSEYGQELLASTSMISKELIESFPEFGDKQVLKSALIALYGLERRSNSEVKGELISIGFQQLLDSLGREESAERKIHLISIVEHLAFGKSEGNLDDRCPQLSASMNQDLSNCLVETIEAAPALSVKEWKTSYDWCISQAVTLLMKINPARGSNVILERGSNGVLHSCNHFEKRGHLLFKLGQYEGAVHDLERARELDSRHFSGHAYLCRAKLALKDWKGALKELDPGPDWWDTGLIYQERGVIKRMTGDLAGALEDLGRGLQLSPSDYELLKQRGYVKFLLGDREGAQADAEEALRVRPMASYPDHPDFDPSQCLGTSIVEFLNFKL